MILSGEIPASLARCQEDAALQHVEQMIAEGADVIDVGGESTRPGYQKITEQEEISRTVEIIKKIKQRFDIPVSIDTYKAKVAEAAIDPRFFGKMQRFFQIRL